MRSAALSRVAPALHRRACMQTAHTRTGTDAQAKRAKHGRWRRLTVHLVRSLLSVARTVVVVVHVQPRSLLLLVVHVQIVFNNVRAEH
jgi:hypothetical protein